MVKIYNKEEFTEEVERLVRSDSLTYVEAIREVCERRNIDIEDLLENNFITPPLKAKISEQANLRGSVKGAKLTF
jgi:hypothetical protein